ncbi:hypothetical protein yc1106_00926 [Curvularia clavata]|uniref:Uncharacterized protein n=1 Tax=Curvularia clavata TaxID=95742 RepID=A0A9Q8Z0V9_CURCL|nr:hypothetical protein yc1106_00926 [Curvularia clavata]
MSGLEVVAAIAAVISAFHGGSELLKHVRKKRSARKTRSSAQQEWEEAQLQASLVAGEQQIGQHYDRDQRELGDLVRIGDDIARERLYHITLMLQAEIINSLKQAATSEVCVLDLRFLHRASNTNRKETLTTLEELKQRIYLRRPMARQLQDLSGESRLWQSRLLPPQTQANSHESTRPLLDEYASYPSHVDYRHTVQSPAEYYRSLGNRDTPSPALPAYEPAQAADLNLGKALERLPPDHRAAAMRDIQKMIMSYQGLSLDSRAHQQQRHGYNDSYSGRHEFYSAPSDRHVSESVVTDFEKEIYDQLQNLGATPDQDTVHSRPLVFKQDMFGLEKEQSEYLRPFHSMQTRAPRQPRWSESSGGSSSQSNIASLDRNSSNSSQGSSNKIPCAPSQQPLSAEHARVPSVPATFDEDSKQDEDRRSMHASSSYSASEDEYTPPPIPPLAPSRSQPNTSPNDPPGKPSNSEIAPKTNASGVQITHQTWSGTQPTIYSPLQTQYTVEITANNAPSSTQAHHRTPSSLSALAASLNPKKLTRTTSINRSVRSQTSTSSSSSASNPSGPLTRTTQQTTIPSNPLLPTETIMHGRPDKSNDYWGFCKGAWATQESLSKGLAVRAQPCGYYVIKHQWSCRYCVFAGPVFKAPHPSGKKGKSIDIVDPRVKVSAAGVRYRWVFLAKSHVRKKIGGAPTTTATQVAAAVGGAVGGGDDNFGCVFCCLEDRVSGVYGGVETLMKHVLQVHGVKGMSEQVCRKAKCILGRVARTDEEFDVNIPFLGSEAADRLREMGE